MKGNYYGEDPNLVIMDIEDYHNTTSSSTHAGRQNTLTFLEAAQHTRQSDHFRLFIIHETTYEVLQVSILEVYH